MIVYWANYINGSVPLISYQDPCRIIKDINSRYSYYSNNEAPFKIRACPAFNDVLSNTFS